MKVVQHILFLLLLSPMWLLAQTESLQPIDPLYPEEWTGAGVEWYRLTVPQDRAKPADKQVKLAIAILKKTKADATAKPVLFLEGGPGGSGIEGIWNFLEHPMRAHSDIVLVDVRGSGFSEPRLCPDLGNEFLQIFAKDQGPEEMEKEKIAAAMACRQSMIGKGIDWKMYNSKVIVQDLEDLRRALGHDQWQVYGVSYGTYVAQVYAEDHPKALQSMILDSSIPDIHKYYNSNSTKFLGAMQKVFDHCDADPDCKSAYPQLKEQFFATIAQLKEQAIEVEVDPQIVESGTFAYNAEDFKVAIQQSLYDERMVAVMPLLIQAFHDGNKETLGSLVQAFSRALVLDYGLYYCMSCAEAVPRNELASFDQDAAQYPDLGGGMNFYRSDFAVCQKWTEGEELVETLGEEDSSRVEPLAAPVLIFGGEFDPITPIRNADLAAAKFPNTQVIKAAAYGHVPSISFDGLEVMAAFTATPGGELPSPFKTDRAVDFANDIAVNGGVSRLANSINAFDPLFFAPIGIAVLVLLAAIFGYLFHLIRRRDSSANVGMKILLVLTSVFALLCLVGLGWAVSETAGQNFFILAFGLPEKYNYLFYLQLIFAGLLGLSLLYFVARIRNISNASVVSSVLFSCLLIGLYFHYWGFYG